MMDLPGVLHAAGPDPDLAGPLALFGRFIGAWEIEWRGTDRDGNRATMPPTYPGLLVPCE